MTNEWEEIARDTFRLKIPQGWLIKNQYIIHAEDQDGKLYAAVGISMVFVPFPHKSASYTPGNASGQGEC